MSIYSSSKIVNYVAMFTLFFIGKILSLTIAAPFRSI